MACCMHCHDLDLYYLTIPIKSLEEGVQEGCAACKLLYQCIGFFANADDDITALDLLVERALYVMLLAKDGNPIKIIELYTDIERPCAWSKIGPGRAVSPDPASNECLTLAREWLSVCLEHHPICKPQASTPLPTRVIDVGEGKSSTGVRLYTSKRENARYVALSHCWGSRLPIATTSATLEDRMKSIQFDSSSKTFADAVHVTRQLGIRYLWIDSLCIIQKNAADWATEAGRMSEVFRNATVTLSADAAADASCGLFSSTKERQSKHECRSIPVPGLGGQTSTVHVRLRANNPCDPGQVPHSSFAREETKLSTRAWVLQERLLSPRMLHFFEEEMVWSCSSHTLCECRYQASTSAPGAFRRLLSSVPDPKELTSEWPRIVADFTRKKLTMKSDRLPAISGLAGLMHQKTSGEYHCGLWNFDMEYGLLWCSDHHAAEESDPIARCSDDDYVPTWSWACVTGPVHYFDRFRTQFEPRTGKPELKPLLKVLRVATTPSGPNKYGAVSGGGLILVGQILPVQYIAERLVWRPIGTPYDSQDPIVEPAIYFDVNDEAPRLTREDGQVIVTFMKHDFVFLRAATYISGGMWSTAARENVCLLLRRLPSEQNLIGEFSRVGFVMFGFSSETVWKSPAVVESKILIV